MVSFDARARGGSSWVRVGSWSMESPCGVVLRIGRESECFSIASRAMCRMRATAWSSLPEPGDIASSQPGFVEQTEFEVSILWLRAAAASASKEMCAHSDEAGGLGEEGRKREGGGEKEREMDGKRERERGKGGGGGEEESGRREEIREGVPLKCG